LITTRQIRSVERAALAWYDDDPLGERLRALKRTRSPFMLVLDELDEIVRWKLGSQYGRAATHRAGLTDEHVRIVTRAAFEISSEDRALEALLRTGMLTTLPSIGVPIASAALALLEPDRYAVVDFRVWRQLFPSPRASFSAVDYRNFMLAIWPLAAKLGWPARKVEACIWEYDRQHGARTGAPSA
jgi:hypothetical protein